MLITHDQVRRVRRQLFCDNDADAVQDEQGLGHPDRQVDFTIRPVSAEWRLVGRKPAYRSARANVQYIWRDSAGADRFGAMPSWFGQRTYDLRSAGLLLPNSAPQWATTDYELWDRVDAATAATGDPTAGSAWHILAEMPNGLDEQWWDWLAVTFAERSLVRVGAPVAYAVHALAAPDGGWAIAPHVHMVVPARRYRSGARHGEPEVRRLGRVRGGAPPARACLAHRLRSCSGEREGRCAFHDGGRVGGRDPSLPAPRGAAEGGKPTGAIARP